MNVNDAIIKAPEFHEVLFENLLLRVLLTNSLPGEEEPLHLHQYNSIMVITEGSKFEIVDEVGNKEICDYPEGIYEIPGEVQCYKYINIGQVRFQAVRFEFK